MTRIFFISGVSVDYIITPKEIPLTISMMTKPMYGIIVYTVIDVKCLCEGYTEKNTFERNYCK